MGPIAAPQFTDWGLFVNLLQRECEPELPVRERRGKMTAGAESDS
jgi:hypothetical protein